MSTPWGFEQAPFCYVKSWIPAVRGTHDAVAGLNPGGVGCFYMRDPQRFHGLSDRYDLLEFYKYNVMYSGSNGHDRCVSAEPSGLTLVERGYDKSQG